MLTFAVRCILYFHEDNRTGQFRTDLEGEGGWRKGVRGDLSRNCKTGVPTSQLTKSLEDLLKLALHTLSKVSLIFASWLKYSIRVGQW